MDDVVFAPDEVGDIVIEAFACDLPSAYLDAMVQRVTAGGTAPAWLNLEYLSAEDWVEGCHALPSPHPSLPLTKHFFFPGFTAKTGGLILERGLLAQRDAFQRDPQAVAAFFADLGVSIPHEACTVSLFCYPTAPVSDWFEASQADDRPVICLVPQGVAADAVRAFLQRPATVGASATHGALTVQVVPFVDQEKYDKLLWACDFNFVRGEDSFVRAQWAGRPFVWQIYQQKENAHADKLDAFLGRYVEGMPSETALALTRFHLAWNGLRETASLVQLWQALRENLTVLERHGSGWARSLVGHGDLATSLLQFVAKIG